MRWVLLAALLAGCSSKSGDTAQTVQAVTTEYTVRGRLIADQGRTLQIRHEAMPKFLDAKGDVIGMKAMKMAFSLGTGVTHSAVPGDAIEFNFTMNYAAKPQMVITALKVLPPETHLTL